MAKNAEAGNRGRKDRARQERNEKSEDEKPGETTVEFLASLAGVLVTVCLS